MYTPTPGVGSFFGSERYDLGNEKAPTIFFLFLFIIIYNSHSTELYA